MSQVKKLPFEVPSNEFSGVMEFFYFLCNCSLPELLLYPARRIGEYVALLSWFHMYTPTDHADRDDLQQAILALKDLNKIINQCHTRMEREKEIKQIQKRIINCPVSF